MHRGARDLLVFFALALFSELLFFALGAPQWLQQRLSATDPGSPLWALLPALLFVALWLVWHGWWSLARRETLRDAPQRLHENRQRFVEVTEALAEGLLIFDPQGHLFYMNPEAERLLGWSANELEHRDVHQLIHRHEWEPVPPQECAIQRALTDGKTHRVQDDMFLRRDGSCFPVAYAAAPMLREGQITGVVTVFEDISERKRLQQELEHLATHDALTGLINRGELERRLRRELERAERYGHPLGLLMLDIDRFKAVNDTFGHHAGDVVLRSFALRLAEHARRADVVGRYGGEEFVVILPETPVAAAVAVAERIRLSLDEVPLGAEEIVIPVTASIGVAGFPAHGRTGEELLQAADRAMYLAKKGGRNRVHTAPS